jgi:uncharacterized protein (TIRG00374 family)
MKRWRRTLPRLLLVAAGVILFGVVLRAVPRPDVWSALRQLSPAELVSLAGVNAAILLTLAARWWILLRAQGFTLPYWRLVRYRLTAFGISYFTPGPHFGGEPYQVYAVAAWHHVPYGASIAAVTLDKLLEMLVNFTFLAGGVLLILRSQPLVRPFEGQLLIAALILLLLPVGLIAALGLQKHPISRPLAGVRAWWMGDGAAAEPHWLQLVRQSEEQVTLVCRDQPRLFALALLISIASWILLIGEFWLMTAMLNLGMGPVAVATALIAARIAILLPLPAALGTLEASQMLAASALGLPPAAGVALGLLIRGRDILVACLGLALGGLDVWRGLLPQALDATEVTDSAALPGPTDPMQAPTGQ